MAEAGPENGDRCVVTGGTHAGKSGIVEDRRTSKTGHVTVTVREADGVRFKTLARNVRVEPEQEGASRSG
jgi:ribosomal protein S4E